MTRISAHDFEPSWFPVRFTFLRDGVVLETQLVTDPGVLTVGRHGPGVVLLIEFGDGRVEAAAAPDEQGAPGAGTEDEPNPLCHE
jgi:hypothetical protein